VTLNIVIVCDWTLFIIIIVVVDLFVGTWLLVIGVCWTHYYWYYYCYYCYC